MCFYRIKGSGLYNKYWCRIVRVNDDDDDDDDYHAQIVSLHFTIIALFSASDLSVLVCFGN